MASLELVVGTQSVNEAIRSVDRLERNINQLATRFAQGRTTQSSYMRGLNQLSTEYARMGKNANQARSEVFKLANAQRQMVAGTAASNRGLARSSVLMQQTGYQVGDFIVQVQSGTNAFVAFGQQAAQVAGTLTLLGGKMVLIGSALGVAIPLFTALAAAYMRTRQESDGAGDGMESFEDRLKSAKQEIQSTALELERLNRGLEDNTQLTLSQAIDQAQAEVDRARMALEGAQRRSGSGGPGITVGQAGGDVEAAREALRLAEERLEVYNSQREQIERINQQNELNNSLEERAIRLHRERVEALLEAGRVAEQGRQARAEMAQDLGNEIQLYRQIATYGEESAQVEMTRRLIARQVYEEKVRETTANEDLIAQHMALYDEMVRVEGVAESVADTIDRLGGANMGGLIGQINNVAGALGIAADEAARLVGGVRALAIFQAQGGGGRGGDPRDFDGPAPGEFNPSQEIINRADALIRERRSVGRSSGGGGGGGGGGSAQEWMTMFPRLEEQLNSYNERVEEAERSYALLDDALEAGLISQDEYLQKMREVEAQYGPLGKELEKVGEMAKDIAGIVGNELSAAFGAVIDGSKTVGEALMDFAQNTLMKIAQMLFDKLIVNPLMNALGGALGGISLGAANGAAFNSGGIQAFADGGVVGSPTLFKFANGGKVGLMGEAGPEAILPLSRGSDGKLGVKSQGGGSPVNVVVNNYSNEQADVKQNGQDLEITIGRVISRDIQNGGPTYRAMRKTFGLRQPTTTRG